MYRENKLWEGSRMILPEHRRAMIEASIHEQTYVEKPVLDEEKFSEMSQVLGEAMRRKTLITLTIYDPYGPRKLTMLPKYFDESTRTLRGLSQLGEQNERVALEEIIDVSCE